MAVLKSTAEAAKEDLKLLDAEAAEFESKRITDNTSVTALQARFPAAAKSVEVEGKKHEVLTKISPLLGLS